MKEEKKETTDEMVSLKVRTFIGLIISIITITNSFTLIYQKIHRNAENQEYNKDRSDRVSDRKKQEAIAYYQMESLKQQLKHCVDANN